MKNLGRSGRLGEDYDVRLSEDELIRIYCLSVLSERDSYGAVRFPGALCDLRLHEQISILHPHIAQTAINKMAERTDPECAASALQSLVESLGVLTQH